MNLFVSPLNLVEYFGTRWPVQNTWQKVSSGVFQGEDGLLSLSIHDGMLIDPARCHMAQQSRTADWELVRTLNGIAITGTYADRVCQVLAYSVRADDADITETAYAMPEVQATYVIPDNRRDVLDVMRDALGHRALAPGEFGTLDAYGHAAMGPVPFHATWLPAGDFVDNSGRLGTAAFEKAFLMLVGGGWLLFADEQRCCGVRLQPMAWRDVCERRTRSELLQDVELAGLSTRVLSVTEARVWECPVSQPGISYDVLDSLGNLRGLGALWKDSFGQAWRLHYWLHPEHGKDAIETLLRLNPPAS